MRVEVTALASTQCITPDYLLSHSQVIARTGQVTCGLYCNTHWKHLLHLTLCAFCVRWV